MTSGLHNGSRVGRGAPDRTTTPSTGFCCRAGGAHANLYGPNCEQVCRQLKPGNVTGEYCLHRSFPELLRDLPSGDACYAGSARHRASAAVVLIIIRKKSNNPIRLARLRRTWLDKLAAGWCLQARKETSGDHLHWLHHLHVGLAGVVRGKRAGRLPGRALPRLMIREVESLNQDDQVKPRLTARSYSPIRSI